MNEGRLHATYKVLDGADTALAPICHGGKRVGYGVFLYELDPSDPSGGVSSSTSLANRLDHQRSSTRPRSRRKSTFRRTPSCGPKCGSSSM